MRIKIFRATGRCVLVEKEIFLRMGNVDLALESMEKYQMVHDDIFYFGQNKAK
jgi:hypothetical protein